MRGNSQIILKFPWIFPACPQVDGLIRCIARPKSRDKSDTDNATSTQSPASESKCTKHRTATHKQLRSTTFYPSINALSSTRTGIARAYFCTPIGIFLYEASAFQMTAKCLQKRTYLFIHIQSSHNRVKENLWILHLSKSQKTHTAVV